VGKGLSKAKAWVEQNAFAVNAKRLQQPQLLLQEAMNLGDHVLIMGVDLHLLRLALHMHHADTKASGTRVGQQRAHLRILKATHIVDEIDADVQGRIDHAGSTAVE
jgi:hypothetical protein